MSLLKVILINMSKMIRPLIFIVSFFLVCLPDANAEEHSDFPIAEAMRDYQSRWKYLSDRNSSMPDYVQWPACLSGQLPPPYPSNRFYETDGKFKDRRVDLVKSFRDVFWDGFNRYTIYDRFIKEFDGVEDLVFYSISDFPRPSNTEIESNPDGVLFFIQECIEKMQFLQVNESHYPVDVEYRGGERGDMWPIHAIMHEGNPWGFGVKKNGTHHLHQRIAQLD